MLVPQIVANLLLCIVVLTQDLRKNYIDGNDTINQLGLALLATMPSLGLSPKEIMGSIPLRGVELRECKHLGICAIEIPFSAAEVITVIHMQLELYAALNLLIFSTLIHGLVDRIMEVIGTPFVKPGDNAGYYIERADESEFLPGRQARIIFKGKCIGAFGIVHPEVLNNFGIPDPCSFVELNIESFL
ncbi:hypothetical protein TEA_005623 [Camellia sinensis var. sinensis]|uniref:Phenylalanyl tRNA synthetase beta chain core domain-containing protein n=1 Tax=Camellia sinensis var. sinensis TaxID=542762 RepID=A0A4S4DJ20_CAMSN|nr:hypothetical protein TEA_005623 [Camellia sinensis var. sinensis]